jgi:hypothetical protein
LHLKELNAKDFNLSDQLQTILINVNISLVLWHCFTGGPCVSESLKTDLA